jgi:hypothetical protein
MHLFKKHKVGAGIVLAREEQRGKTPARRAKGSKSMKKR